MEAEDLKKNARATLDWLAYELAGRTFRDGCAYRAPSEQCENCRPLYAVRAAIKTEYKRAWPDQRMWFEFDPQHHPELPK